jgi:hypothetical protein
VECPQPKHDDEPDGTKRMADRTHIKNGPLIIHQSGQRCNERKKKKGGIHQYTQKPRGVNVDALPDVGIIT